MITQCTVSQQAPRQQGLQLQLYVVGHRPEPSVLLMAWTSAVGIRCIVSLMGCIVRVRAFCRAAKR